MLANLRSQVEIAAFKSGLEEQGPVLRPIEPVAPASQVESPPWRQDIRLGHEQFGLLLALRPRDRILQLVRHPLTDVPLPDQLLHIEEVFMLEDIFLGELVDALA